jgi:hypothetical protein
MSDKMTRRSMLSDGNLCLSEYPPEGKVGYNEQMSTVSLWGINVFRVIFPANYLFEVQCDNLI